MPAAPDVRSDRAEARMNEVGWELFRSLGAFALTPPPGNGALCAALDLPIPTGVEYTDAFVLSAPPHGAIHLGPEGKLGGEGLDRIAGFWRVLGLPAAAVAGLAIGKSFALQRANVKARSLIRQLGATVDARRSLTGASALLQE